MAKIYIVDVTNREGLSLNTQILLRKSLLWKP